VAFYLPDYKNTLFVTPLDSKTKTELGHIKNLKYNTFCRSLPELFSTTPTLSPMACSNWDTREVKLARSDSGSNMTK